MGRISDGELARLKADVSLVKLVERAGVALVPHGKDWLGRCPFHDDKTPSLVVTPDKNLWHCLGACSVGGSVIDWVMTQERVSFTQAVELLRRDFPALVAEARTDGRRYVGPKFEAAFTRTADDQALLNQVIDYYHQTLKQTPTALQYLAQRGLTHPEVIDAFKLGYANRTLGYRLPTTKQKGGPALRGQLQRLGLMRASGHEHFNGSLVIPILDEQKNVVGVYGRKVTPNLRAGTPDHLYLAGPHRGVFNVAGLKGQQEIILCEALIDALTFWSAGYRHVTASYGVNGFTAELRGSLKLLGVERVLIAYDRDGAGDAAAVDLARTLNGEGIECFRVLFPKGMDANAYALKVTPSAKSLGVALRKAEWLGKGPARVAVTTAAREAAPASEATSVIGAVPETGSAAAVPDETDNATDNNPTSAAADAPVSEPASIPADELPSLAAELEALDELDARLDALAAVTSPATADAAADAVLPALPASPVAVAAAVDVPAEVGERDVTFTFGDRRYRVRGLDKNLSYELLKVNLLASRGEAVHVDTFDLYSARHRHGFIRQAAVELGAKEDVVKHDLGRVLLKLETLQDQAIQAALAPKAPVPTMSDAEHDAALALLRDPNLVERIVLDLEASGVVGERTALLTGYLACVSRALDRPLAILIQSTSAAGKSALMDAVLAMMPEDACVRYSAMTGQSLFYLGETDLKHKILAIAEEEGAAQAAYALKLLQSEGVLTIASTGKDPATGKLVTQAYRVEGPVMLFLTTTAIEIDEELLNRCLVLTVNESREQTRAIHARQRAQHTLAGLLAESDVQALRSVHRNAQRLLQPLLVANPYAERLTFLDAKTRTRRDHVKYLTLIRTVALLHQQQRPVRRVTHGGRTVEYIEATLDDIALANTLAHEVLGRTLDELPPQTRRLLDLVHAHVTAECSARDVQRADHRFSRRELRTATDWSDTQLRVHLGRLVELEYVLVHRGTRGQSYVYELVYAGEGADGAPFLPGLIDVAALREAGTTGSSRGETGGFAGAARGASGPVAAGARRAKSGANADDASASLAGARRDTETAPLLGKTSPPSHRTGTDEAQAALFAAGE